MFVSQSKMETNFCVTTRDSAKVCVCVCVVEEGSDFCVSNWARLRNVGSEGQENKEEEAD